MDQTNPTQQPAATTSKLLTTVELQYYYFGFHRALKRHRTMTIIGWIVVAIGCVSFPVGWSIGRPDGLLEIALSCSTVVAGLGLVWQSVSFLDAYVQITLPCAHNGELHPLIHEVAAIMKDVDDGGWQEAHAAMRRMEDLQSKYDLPSL